MTNPAVAVVTGASRGAGKGIAIGLGEKGMTVFVTGRSVDHSDAVGWDGKPLAGTIHETAAAVTAAGGRGIALACDHGDDAQIAALFDRVRAEAGQLDILVNNATHIHHQLIEQAPFWEKELAAVGIIDVGLRSAYVASWHAAKPMVEQGSGLIAFTSSFGASCYMHGPAYGAQKAGTDKMSADMAVELRPFGAASVSIWMGFLKTARTAAAVAERPGQFDALMAMAEMPDFTGRVIAAIHRDPAMMDLSGRTVIGAEQAREYGVLDIDENSPDSLRPVVGGPFKYDDLIID